MRGHNICFCSEIRKIIFEYPHNPLLSGALVHFVKHLKCKMSVCYMSSVLQIRRAKKGIIDNLKISFHITTFKCML